MRLKEIKEKYLDSSFLLKEEFATGDYNRDSVLDRCMRYAGWTLPAIFPDENLHENDELQNDYQSLGAQLVTNLANKIMMALFQPSRPFFKLELDKDDAVALAGAGLSEAMQDEALAQAERDAMKDLAKMGARVSILEAILQLIITGNSLLFSPKNGKMQVYSLRDYVIKRNLRGELMKLIMREVKSVSGLSDDLAALAMQEGFSESDEVSIFTCVLRTDNNKFVVWQELESICYCHQKVGVYTEDTLPWLPLTWNLARGKDYGTGLVESYSGDFHSLSTIAEAIIDFTTVATDVKTLVNPMGMTDVREISQAPSGAYVHGREEDLHTYSAEITQVTDFLEKQFNSIERRLAQAFLLNSSVTRDAERVTAEEIRLQAMELESSLGGVYSRFAMELQQPLATRLVKKQNELFKDIEITIVTGLDSLSRNSDLANFRAFIGDLKALAELPEAVLIRMEMGNVIAILGTGHGVEYDKFLKDEDVVVKEEKERLVAEAKAQEQLVQGKQANRQLQ